MNGYSEDITIRNHCLIHLRTDCLAAGLYADVSGVCGSSCGGYCCILEGFYLGGGKLIMTRNSTVTITNIIEIMVCFFVCTVFTFPINQ
jgi:hypothetical protein